MDCILQEEIIRLVNLGIYTVESCFIVPELLGATIISVTVTPGGFEFHSDRGNVTVRRNVELTEEGYIYVEGRSQVTHTDLILWHDDSDGSIREVNKTRARLGRELLMLPSERSARAKVISKARAEEKKRKLNAALTAPVAGKTIKEVRATSVYGITFYFTDGTECRVGYCELFDKEDLPDFQVDQITLR